ncbi:MAG: SPASM domain-containing protein, partial [Actinobacteria bacterium]|nr:SPASM domain-containing protein [Actinomycetota bacterium]
MYFDQFGRVRACCQNSDGLLGDVTRQSVREIWESAQAGRLREALAVRDLSVGCGFCAWQAEEVGYSEFARGFDDLDPASIAPRWPLRMEFSMTNSCNLQCVMCNGDLSSSIRAHREHRAPLPEVYGERFFEELAEFLPHLVEARFLGGEPFLGREP